MGRPRKGKKAEVADPTANEEVKPVEPAPPEVPAPTPPPPADPPPPAAPEPTPRKGPPRWRLWLVQFGLPVALGVGLLGGGWYAADLARKSLRARNELVVMFADVECEPPEGLTREGFLEEAQYYAQLPDKLNFLDPNTRARLHDALLSHPRVERVSQVQILPGGRVKADIVYRLAVLKVAQPAGFVDRNGILLPGSSRREGLPELRSRVKPPTGNPGDPWGDEQVTAAVRVVALLEEQAKTIPLKGVEVRVRNGEVTLHLAQAVIHWGRAPGREQGKDMSAEEKIKALLARPTLKGKIDLRPPPEPPAPKPAPTKK